MATSFQIPRILQSQAGGSSELSLEGSTVRELLQQLRRDHPQLYVCLCDETGKVRQHLNLFINDAFLKDRNGLDTPVQAGDVVSVFQAVSGG